MFGSIISDIVDGVVSAAFSWISSIMEKRGLVKQGQAQQAATETATSQKTEQAIATAEANAPTTPNAALERLKDGSA